MAGLLSQAGFKLPTSKFTGRKNSRLFILTNFKSTLMKS